MPNYIELTKTQFNAMMNKVATINKRYAAVKNSSYNKGILNYYDQRLSHLPTVKSGISKAGLNKAYKDNKITKSVYSLINNMSQERMTINKYHNSLKSFYNQLEDVNIRTGLSEKYELAEELLDSVHDVIENYSQAIYNVKELSDAVHRSSKLTPAEVKKIVDLSKVSKSDKELDEESYASRLKDWRRSQEEEVNPFG